jgi:hypothetical protein
VNIFDGFKKGFTSYFKNLYEIIVKLKSTLGSPLPFIIVLFVVCIIIIGVISVIELICKIFA